MKLFPTKTTATYTDLISGYERAINPNAKASIPEIDAAAQALVDFEKATGIDSSRRTLAKERELLTRLETFRKLVDRYSALSEQARLLVDGLASGEVAPNQLESAVAMVDDRSAVVKIAKATVELLETHLAANAKAKSALSKTALENALEIDPLSAPDRRVFEQRHDDARRDRREYAVAPQTATA
jgi:hypothetical protein